MDKKNSSVTLHMLSLLRILESSVCLSVCIFPNLLHKWKQYPSCLLRVGADFAGSFPMLFKGNSMSDPASLERLVLHCTSWPFNAILPFINPSANVPAPPLPCRPFTLKALHCGNQEVCYHISFFCLFSDVLTAEPIFGILSKNDRNRFDHKSF